jgi:nicotinamidase-related amidase
LPLRLKETYLGPHKESQMTAADQGVDAGPGKSCLLIIDMINPFTFPDAADMFPALQEVAQRIRHLKGRARAAEVPVLYVNDNFGKWQHDLQSLVQTCLADQCQGRGVAETLRPDPDDYFVLKPKHSGFFATPLELLLRFLHVDRLILTGVAGDHCVLYTAADAYMRDFPICTPRDCIASLNGDSNEYALEQMRTTLKADVRPSTELRF